MRTGVLSSFVGAVLLLAPGTPRAVGADGDPITVELKDFTFKVKEDKASLFNYDENEGKLCFYANGPAEATVKIPTDGEYEIIVKASCDPAQNERAKFKLSLDGQAVGQETLLTADEAKEYKLTAKLKAGDRKLVVEFTNDAYKENEYDRNLFVHAVTLKRAK